MDPRDRLTNTILGSIKLNSQDTFDLVKAILADGWIHPECDPHYERLLRLEEFFKLNRHSLNDIQAHGKTILDFFNHWLDASEAQNAKLRGKLEFAKELTKRMTGQD